MRKDLNTFIRWAIRKAQEMHPNANITYDEYIGIAQNVWMDMVENGEIYNHLDNPFTNGYFDKQEPEEDLY